MSPSWRDGLRVLLAPGAVTLLHARRGLRRRIDACRTLGCDPVADRSTPWREALETLQAALGEFATPRAEVSVVVSSHFARYLVVPADESLETAEQEEAFARHHFRRVHGDAADAWELRVDRGRGRRLACALDAALLHALREVCRRRGMRLASVQPYLMTQFNVCRRRMPGDDGWLALAEPGLLCLARIERGAWSRLRTMRVDDDWSSRLPALLERESWLGGEEPAATELPVFVSAPGPQAERPPGDPRWRMVVLAAPTHPGLPPQADAWCRMAAGGWH